MVDAVMARWCPDVRVWEAVSSDGRVVGTYPTLIALEYAVCEDES